MGILSKRDYVQGGYVRGIISRGLCPVDYMYVQGIISRRHYVQGDYVQEALCPGGLYPGVLCPGGIMSRGLCPGDYVLGIMSRGIMPYTPLYDNLR